MLLQELRHSRSVAGSTESLAEVLGEYRASDFISIFQKFKLAFNLLVSVLNGVMLVAVGD